MRAAIRTSGTIGFSDSVAKPSPKAGQLLVRIMAAAINPVDYKLPKLIAGEVPGIDFSGIVEAIGPEVVGFSKGDEVFGFATGSVAEYAACSAAKVAMKPSGLDWKSAACLPTAYVTSYQSLKEHGRMQPGHRVLVFGASGGCGSAACQLAKAIGATEVVGVCSAANSALVLANGATRVVDYRDAAAYEALLSSAEGSFDVVYDCASGSGAGEDYSRDAARVVKPGGGTVVAINGGITSWLKLLFKLQSDSRKLMITRQNGEDLREIVSLLGGSPRPVVDSIHPLSAEGVNAAFGRLKSRRAKGKLVIDVGAVCDSGSG